MAEPETKSKSDDMSKIKDIINSINASSINKLGMKVDYAPGSKLESSLEELKKFASLQVTYLQKMVGYQEIAIRDARLASVSSAAVSAGKSDSENVGTNKKKTEDTPKSGIENLLNGLLGGLVKGISGFGSLLTATIFGPVIGRALTGIAFKLIPAILGPLTGFLTGPVGLGIIAAAVLVGGAMKIDEYLTGKRNEFIKEINDRVTDGLDELKTEKDLGVFDKIGINLGLSRPETTTGSLYGLETSLNNYRNTPSFSGRGPLPPNVLAESQRVDLQKAKKDLDPKAYADLLQQIEAIKKAIQNPTLLPKLSMQKLELFKRLSVLLADQIPGATAIIDKVIEKKKRTDVLTVNPFIDTNASTPAGLAKVNWYNEYGIDRDRQGAPRDASLTVTDQPIAPSNNTPAKTPNRMDAYMSAMASTSSMVPTRPAAPTVVIIPAGRAGGVPMAQPNGPINSGNVVTNTYNLREDPAKALMFNQVPGGSMDYNLF